MTAIIRIPHEKVESISEHLEKGLRYVGKAMQCIDELKGENEMGERYTGVGFGMRYGMGNRYGMGMRGGYGNRWDDDEYDDEFMGERRGVPGTGRYSRLR